LLFKFRIRDGTEGVITLKFDWITWSIWFIGLIILIVWIIVPMKELRQLIKKKREEQARLK